MTNGSNQFHILAEKSCFSPGLSLAFTSTSIERGARRKEYMQPVTQLYKAPKCSEYLNCVRSSMLQCIASYVGKSSVLSYVVNCVFNQIFKFTSFYISAFFRSFTPSHRALARSVKSVREEKPVDGSTKSFTAGLGNGSQGNPES